MDELLVLLDPGLVMPPAADDGLGNFAFWTRLIEWSGDRRTYLGELGHSVVVDSFTERGWPAYAIPFCPQELSRIARDAVGRLLARIAVVEAQPDCAGVFSPAYVFDDDCAAALSLDVRCRFRNPLRAIGSSEEHWAESVDRVAVTPGPPDLLDLIVEPGTQLPAETTLRAARELRDRRLQIVGGLRNERVVEALREEFQLQPSQIRWAESEPGREPSLGSWRQLDADRDVACAVLGTEGVVGLSHSGSEKAEELAVGAGVIFLKVRTPQQIADALRGRLGS